MTPARHAMMISMIRDLSYNAVGLTHPDDEAWSEHPKGYRRHTVTLSLGHGKQCWDEAVGAHGIRFWLTKSGPVADGHIGVFGPASTPSVGEIGTPVAWPLSCAALPVGYRR